MAGPDAEYRLLQVGCGPTGTSLLRQLLPRLAQTGVPVHYEVADPGAMGEGLAFSTPYDLHLLNVRADRMSLDPEDAGEFARWRTERAAVWTADFADPAGAWHDYPPRRLFGAYARSVLDEALRAARARGQRVEVTADAVVAACPVGPCGSWCCRFASGKVATYDRVVLSLGHLPQARYGPHEGRRGFLRDPWGGVPVHEDAAVGVIGTRLTGIDTAMTLRERGHRGRVVLGSRSGLLPSVKGRIAGHQLSEIPRFVARRRTATLGEIAAVVRWEVEAAETVPVDWDRALRPPPSNAGTLRADLAIAESGRVITWQSVLAAIVPWVPHLWRLLDSSGREAFMADYVGLWAARIASFPAVTAGRLLEMMESGQLAVRHGLTTIEQAGRGYRMRFDGGDSNDDDEIVDAVVNATGPGHGRDSLNAVALTRDLLDSATVVPHPYGGIVIDEHTFEAIDPHGTVSRGLHALGDLTRGVWLATNAVENTVRQTAALADVLTRLLSAEPVTPRRPHRRT
jgi:uncharacterized NAD(P)/FAD-binding protein YdhS